MFNEPPGRGPVREAPTDALIVCDDQNLIIEVTRSACELMGYSREDLLSRPLQDLVVTSEAMEASRLLEKLHEEASIAFESSLRAKDGTTQPFHLRLSRLSVSGRRHSLVRMTRRRRAADKLPEDREFIRAVLNLPGSLLLVLDHEGRVAFFNKACETATGRSFDDLRGKGLWELASHEPEAMRLRSAFAELGRGRFPARLESGFRRGWSASGGPSRGRRSGPPGRTLSCSMPTDPSATSSGPGSCSPATPLAARRPRNSAPSGRWSSGR
jgi:PAS domain S-box-containing protein